MFFFVVFYVGFYVFFNVFFEDGFFVKFDEFVDFDVGCCVVYFCCCFEDYWDFVFFV